MLISPGVGGVSVQNIVKSTNSDVGHVNMSGPGHGATGDPGHGGGFLLFLSSLYSAIFLQGT